MCTGVSTADKRKEKPLVICAALFMSWERVTGAVDFLLKPLAAPRVVFPKFFVRPC